MTDVSLHNVAGHVAGVAVHPSLARVSSLSLRTNEFSLPGGTALANSPSLHCLRSLQIDWRKRYVLDGSGLLPLFASPHLRLRELLAGEFITTDDVFQSLADNPASGSLIRLSLRVGSCGRSVAALANSPNVGQLEQLALVGFSWDPVDAALIRSPGLPRLTHLRLEFNLRSEAIEGLAVEPNLARLRSLRLDMSRGGDAGAIALARSPMTANLHTLSLVFTGLTDSVRQPSGPFRRAAVF